MRLTFFHRHSKQSFLFSLTQLIATQEVAILVKTGAKFLKIFLGQQRSEFFTLISYLMKFHPQLGK